MGAVAGYRTWDLGLNDRYGVDQAGVSDLGIDTEYICRRGDVRILFVYQSRTNAA